MGRRRKQSITLASTANIEVAEGLVDDPYEPGVKLRVLRNIREHPISRLAHIGKISESQRICAEMFRAKYERAVLGGARAIDYTRERVDGGVMSEPLSEVVQEAVEWLNSCASQSGCGKLGWSVLTHVCGEGRGIQETAQILRSAGAPAGRAGDGYVLGVLIMGLEALIQHLGMEAVGRAKRRA